MKKLIFSILLMFFVGISFSIATCNPTVVQQENSIGQAKFAANIRTYPCTSSSVLRTSQAGERFNVIGKVSGWYKIQLSNGQIAWIRDNSVDIIGPAYTLSQKDKLLVEKVNQKIEKLVEEKGESFRLKLEQALEKLLPKYVSNPRIYTIIDEILKYTRSLQEDQDKQEVQEEQEEVQVNSDYGNFYFDKEKVRQAWLLWHNQQRAKLGLKPYVYNAKLDATAKERSETMKEKGEMNHKRHEGDSYYDYWKIAKWFEDRGVVCENISRATFSESIGYYTTKCNKSDCTDSVLEGAKSVFDYYMVEKGKDWDPHYRGIVHPLFTQMGFGIVIEKRADGWYRYYFTTHYCTRLK